MIKKFEVAPKLLLAGKLHAETHLIRSRYVTGVVLVLVPPAYAYEVFLARAQAGAVVSAV